MELCKTCVNRIDTEFESIRGSYEKKYVIVFSSFAL